VAFWRLFPHSFFTRNPIGKTTGGHRKTTGDLQEVKRNFHCYEGARVDGKGG